MKLELVIRKCFIIKRDKMTTIIVKYITFAILTTRRDALQTPKICKISPLVALDLYVDSSLLKHIVKCLFESRLLDVSYNAEV